MKTDITAINKNRRLFKNINIVGLLLLTFIFAGCAKQPEEFVRIATMKPASPIGINNIRYESLKQSARETGAQAGLSWRSKQLNKLLIDQKSRLNQIFDFNFLVLNHNVLPPVLTEGSDTLNLSDDETIRVADKEYQIVYAPRFVTAPPTWRDYIWMNYIKPEIPNSTLLPKNYKEANVWNAYVKIGWNEGVNQADEIFINNLNRMVRDYNGMILYKKLLAKNMVTAPFVSKADLGVTGGGNDMRINDRVLRITSTSELKANPKVWKPTLDTVHKN